MNRRTICFSVAIAAFALCSLAADWTRFRGPNGSAVSDERGLPATWSSSENIVWRTKLPGPGASSPITLGKRIFVTSYSGYGLAPQQGDMNNLMRHLLCLDRADGKILWQKSFKPSLPESTYSGGNNSRHGYASSTPVTDGEYLYVFFGKSGVYCLDLEGKQIWHTSVGDRATGWGSSNSPVLHKNLVIINASVESGAVVALNKATGKEVWRSDRVRSSWNTPVLVEANGKTEAVLADGTKVFALDADSGKQLWHADVFRRYTCPSVVAHDGIVYATNRSTVAIRAGGRGDVTNSHVLWQSKKGTVVSSPVYHNGLVYLAQGSVMTSFNAKNGNIAYQERVAPNPGTVYASPVIADGKIYCVSQSNGTYVFAGGPKFQQLAHNEFKEDDTRTNASPVVSNGHLLLRTDAYIYCIGKK